MHFNPLNPEATRSDIRQRVAVGTQYKESEEQCESGASAGGRQSSKVERIIELECHCSG